MRHLNIPVPKASIVARQPPWARAIQARKDGLVFIASTTTPTPMAAVITVRSIPVPTNARSVCINVSYMVPPLLWATV